ncbi:MAG: UDP-N-acetylmuramoyl-L-alanine--D-glutamate ligase [Deltaproteobacteria bacterium]|nr:UDP-N-acetylmuramoyl-L-alanine--D-glutamate ligase [Deltaproteobacteria bacterium]
MELSGKKAAIIGIGKTGIATARFLASRGVRMAVTDAKPSASWGEARTALESLPAELTFAPYGPEILAGVDWVIPSPGIPPANPILAEAVRRRIPVLSELELAARFIKTPIVAITGTNGKTTVTSLVGAILREAGRKVFVGGNIGDPLIGYADDPQAADWAVVEVSSFQLQWTETFHPRIAVLLNVTTDHVDYHGSFAAYRAVKEQLFAHQTAKDLAILNGDEAATANLRGRLQARVELFSSLRPVDSGMFLSGEKVIHRLPTGETEAYPVSMIHLPGRHNQENVMAAILAARECGCAPPEIVRAVEGFRGIAHRIQYSGEKKGILFYDDSKGTNVDAVKRALESFSRPVILLLGGRDKEGDFETLAPLIRRGVKAMVLFGEARGKIEKRLGRTVETVLAATLKEAVEQAYGLAASGDVVLLSPGCASFDEFTDYKERGNRFQEWVGQLPG